MRHGKKFNHLGRKTAHRRAMLANMSISLIMYKRINTTVAKAKALQKYVEPLLTRSKSNKRDNRHEQHNRRVVFSYLQDKHCVRELFDVVGDRIANRPGGYTRIIKTNRRLGDNAEMCVMELVDFNDLYTNPSTVTKNKTKRTRRSKGSKSKGDVVSALDNNDNEIIVEEATKDETVNENSDQTESVSEEQEKKED